MNQKHLARVHMKIHRMTIAELMLVVLVTGIGLAALRNASAAWAGAMFSITIFLMISSLLGIGLGRGARRIYWLGFAALGWSYLLLLWVPVLYEHVGRFLLAPNLFAYLEEVLQNASPPRGGLQSLPLGVLGASLTGGGFGGGVSASAQDLSDFARIGLAMEALLWALLGGRVASYFASGREPEVTTPVATSSGATAVAQQESNSGTGVRTS
jgi:hypothetical protein